MISMFPGEKGGLAVMPIYNPITASRVYSTLVVNTYLESFYLPAKARMGIYQDTFLVRGIKDYIPHNPIFRKVHSSDGDNSLMTIIDPLCKDYPNSTELREEIEKQKYKQGLVLRSERVVGLREFVKTGAPPGALKWFSRRRYPTFGTGRRAEDPRPKKNGRYLEDSFQSYPFGGEGD